MKNKQKEQRTIKFLLISNAALTVVVVILFLLTSLQFKAIQGAYDSNAENSFKTMRLEAYLRNRGLVDGALINDDVKPYSIEDMEEFQKWYDERHEDDSEN